MKWWISLVAVGVVAALTVSVRAEEGDTPRSKKVTGEVTAVADGSITMKVTDKDGEKTVTFTTTAKTQVVIETDEDEVRTVKGPAGETTMRYPKTKEGTRADLKAGQRVTVITPDEKAATNIWIRRAAKK
jgi:hypothetical protein